jgi:hypothetical protein
VPEVVAVIAGFDDLAVLGQPVQRELHPEAVIPDGLAGVAAQSVTGIPAGRPAPRDTTEINRTARLVAALWLASAAIHPVSPQRTLQALQVFRA